MFLGRQHKITMLLPSWYHLDHQAYTRQSQSMSLITVVLKLTELYCMVLLQKGKIKLSYGAVGFDIVNPENAGCCVEPCSGRSGCFLKWYPFRR